LNGFTGDMDAYYQRQRQRDAWRRASKRYRIRVRTHERIAEVPYGEAELSFLIRLGWLAEGDADDRRAVGVAISRLIREVAISRHT
jgi:hypothetical protein